VYATLILMMLLSAASDPTTARELAGPGLGVTPALDADLLVDDSVGAFEPPRWINPPSPEASGELTPPFANGIGVGGRVTLSCWAREQGLPQDCEVKHAGPGGLGFEAAALEVARTGVVRPAMRDGEAVPRQIAFTVVFSAQPIESESIPYEGPEPTASALALARQITLLDLEEAMALEEETLLEGLAQDRREIVREWMRELRPLDDERSISNQALMLARLAKESEMAAYLADGTVPTSPTPTPEDMARASSDMYGPQDIAEWTALRDRYCARWSCTSEP
jgi:TonB family protein